MPEPQSPETAAHFVWPIRIYWEDTDAGQIVYHANYLKFFERARSEWMRSLGLGQTELRQNADACVFVVHRLSVHYQAPAKLDDLLHIHTRLIQTRPLRIILEQSAHHAPPPSETNSAASSTLLCSAQIQLACVDERSWRAKKIPPSVLARLPCT